MSFKLFFISVFLSPLSALWADSFVPEKFSVSMIQEYESALPGGEPRKSEGQIDYQYPGLFRFEVKAPDHIVFVSNNEKTWYYTAPSFEDQPGELVISDAGSGGLSRFFDALRNGLESNDSYEVSNKEISSVLTFSKEMANDLDFKKAILNFSNSDQEKSFSQISEIELTYLDGQETKIVFETIDLSPEFKKETFKFETPPNTRVNQN